MNKSIPWWALLIIVALAVLAFAHARKYFEAFQQTDSTTILQASLEDTTSDILSEWSPLIIQDRLVDPLNSLSSTLLRWQYVWKSQVQETRVRDDRDSTTLCRFTLIYSNDDSIVTLKKSHEDPGVDIILSMGRSLILPPGSVYSIKKGHKVFQVRFHDSSTLLLSHFV